MDIKQTTIIQKEQPYFLQNLPAIIEFKNETGRWPKTNSSDKKERLLGIYYDTIRRHARKGELDPNAMLKLQEAGVKFKNEKEDTREEIARLVTFILQNKRVPDVGEPLFVFAKKCYREFDTLPENFDTLLLSVDFLNKWKKDNPVKVPKWDKTFAQVKQYYDTHKKLPGRDTNPRLHNWVTSQRKSFKEGTLSDDQIQKFTDAGIKLKPEIYDKPFRSAFGWDQYYIEVEEFIIANNRAPLSTGVLPRERTLAQWCFAQKRKMDKQILTPDQVERFNALFREKDPGKEHTHSGFISVQIIKSNISESNLNSKRGLHFQKKVAEFSEFKRINNRLPDLQSTNPQEKSLAVWAHKIRTLFSKGTLPKERLPLLEQIEFPLNLHDNQWNLNFNKLKIFIEQTGRLPKNPNPITRFAENCYKNYDTLSDEKKALLKTIPFYSIALHTFKDENSLWKSRFPQLIQFYTSHGRLPVKPDNTKLFGWVVKLRTQLKRGVLRQDFQEQLKNAGIDLLKRTKKKIQPKSAKWSESYKQLLDFIKLNGHFPKCISSDKPQKKLAKWYSVQYYRGKHNRLSAEKFEAFQFLNTLVKDSKSISTITTNPKTKKPVTEVLV